MASRKGGLRGRRIEALKRLEVAYKKFKAAGEDKAPWDSTRKGKPHHHKGNSYQAECARFEKEIDTLKTRII